MTEESAAFAGHVEGAVDGFLYVAASFAEDLAHFAGHVASEFFFAAEEDFSGAVEDFGAFWRGCEAPCGVGNFGGADGGVDVFGVGEGEFADEVVMVGGIDVLKGFASAGRDPLAGDEVLVDLA